MICFKNIADRFVAIYGVFIRNAIISLADRQLTAREVYMGSHRVGRIAVGALLIPVASFSVLMAATGKYQLLNKYSFGAAEGAPREYFDFITVDSAARRV